MRKRHATKPNQIKVILVSDEEEIPDGYTPVAGTFVDGSKMQICIPEKIAKEKSELANLLADQAFIELQVMIAQLGQL